VKNGAIGYVAGHRVVGQRIEDGVLYVTVEMTVKEDPMAEDLQSLRATLLRKGDHRIAILVTDMADSAFGVDLPPTTMPNRLFWLGIARVRSSTPLR
jgi:hypothetical protein